MTDKTVDKEKKAWVFPTINETLAQYGEAPDDCDECEIKFVDYQIYVLRLCPKHTATDALFDALLNMLDVWYFQKTDRFDSAREQAQAAIKLAKKKREKSE